MPVDELTSLYAHVDTPRDLARLTLDQIEHFFAHYKDLEAGKWVKVEGWLGPEEAKREIETGIDRYQSAPEKPNF